MEKPELSEHESKKKVYTPPQLQIYGNLRSITETVNNAHPHGDGGYPSPKNRT